jgi:hypothetical protein
LSVSVGGIKIAAIMKTNIFIPKRLLPERFDFVVESFHMRELIEIESMEEFTHFMDDLRDEDERKLSLRLLTNLDLFEFLSKLDEELMELKGVPFELHFR